MALVCFGISHVGSELSDPFGHDTNDIHLEAFKQTEEDTDGYIQQWRQLKRAELPTSDVDDAGSPPSRASCSKGSSNSVRKVVRKKTLIRTGGSSASADTPAPATYSPEAAAPAGARASAKLDDEFAAAIHPDLAGGAAASEAASDGTGEPRRRKTTSKGAAPAADDPYGPGGCGA